MRSRKATLSLETLPSRIAPSSLTVSATAGDVLIPAGSFPRLGGSPTTIVTGIGVGSLPSAVTYLPTNGPMMVTTPSGDPIFPFNEPNSPSDLYIPDYPH